MALPDLMFQAQDEGPYSCWQDHHHENTKVATRIPQGEN